MNILQTFHFVSGVLLLFVAISSVESTVTLHDLPEPSFDDLDALFTYFKTKYHRDYDGEEHSLRLVYFQESVERIARLKQDNPLAEFGLTEMADYSPDERRRRTGYRSSTSAMSSQVLVSDPPSLVAGIHTLADVPQSVDWRQSGAVNPIRDQMQCGSCWAFAIVAVTEAQWYLKHKEMLQLSEQMLVSCDTSASGCDGAHSSDAVVAIIQLFGGNVSLRSTYPYVSHLGYAPPCDSSFISTGAKIHEVVAIETNETAMLNWVALYGPIDVSIDSTDLSAYHGGIITNATSVELDHAVVIVGYGNTTDTPYWIVRNSWGAAWGEDGYFRVIRGLNMLLIQSNPNAILVE